MSGSTRNRRTVNRRTVNRPAATVPAVLETLESRQLLSTTPLTIVETKSTLPVAALSGQTLKGAVTVQVTNGGTVPLSGPQTFDVYGSTDGTIDASSTLLGSVVKGNLKLGTGKTTHVTVPVKVAAPPIGDYSIFIEAVDGSGNVSDTSGKAPSVAVATPYVSLVAVVGTPKPTALVVNHAVSFKVTITNNGNINAKGPLSAALELSSDGSTVSQTLGTPKVKGVNIKEGGKAVTLVFSTAKITTTGSYYVGGTFTLGDDVFTAFGTTPITIGTNAF